MQVLPRYQLLRQIGEGGSANVFVAQDRLASDRQVVVKFLKPGAMGASRSISTEFLTLSELAIAGVARILDFGLSPSEDGQPGQPYLVRTYIEGRSLDQAIVGLDDRVQAVRWVLQAAHCVAALHRSGVVHGDIKPSNIIVDTSGCVWLIDFGMASAAGDGGAIAGGTPEFMAPELLQSGIPTLGSDVYALGATLWTAVYGSVPFSALSHAQRIRQRQRSQYLELPQSGSPEMQQALEIARRALHPNPTQRTASAAEFAAELERYSAGHDSQQHEVHNFIPPLPRGRKQVVAQLEALVTSGLDPANSPQAIWLQAAPGMGKSTLLQILRWHLQLRGHCVLGMDVKQQDAWWPVTSLRQQAQMWLNLEDGGLDEPMPSRDPQNTVQACVASVIRLKHQRPVVLIVDDLLDAEPFVLDCLRDVLYAAGGHPVVVVASGAQACDGLNFDSVVELDALTQDEVDRMTSDALGALDASVHAAIWKRSKGNPAKTLNLLAQLSQHEAPSAQDVLELKVSDFESALARERICSIGRWERLAIQVLGLAGGKLQRRVVLEGDFWASEGADASRVERALDRLEQQGAVVRRLDDVCLVDKALADAALESLKETDRNRLALAVLSHAGRGNLTFEQCAELSLAIADQSLMEKFVPAACEELCSRGAKARAANWYEQWMPYLEGPQRRAVMLRLAELYQALGVYSKAQSAAASVAEDKQAVAVDVKRARMLLSRLFIAQGRYDSALQVLVALQPALPSAERGPYYRDLAMVHLNCGEYAQAISAASDGLADSKIASAVHVELLTTAGMAHDYLGQLSEADVEFARALELARTESNKLAQANVLNYQAIAKHRRGNYVEARDLYASSLGLARELHNVGSIAVFSLNLGTVESLLGNYVKAEQHYLVAIQAAKHAAKHSTDLMARANLANLKVVLGMYEQARNLLVKVIADAKRQRVKRVEAQAHALMGDVEARTGADENSLGHYAQALRIFEELEQTREVAETCLDAAEAGLVYLKLKDAKHIRTHLERAGQILEEGHFDDLRARLWLVQAIQDVALDNRHAAASLAERALKAALDRGDHELGWRLQALLAQAYTDRPHRAAMCLQAAHAHLCNVADALPLEYRSTFWRDPWRAQVRDLYKTERLDKEQHMAMEPSRPADGIARERIAHLLSVLRRLVSEERLDRLLENITDCAVSFFRAERGFVMLADNDGRLAAHTARAFGTPTDAAFSRSIAEAVFIDNEPLVATDAVVDQRLRDYRSVHKLMLRSVACVPIHGLSRSLGVLYLEHRAMRGRFKDEDVELLVAFADQAALAIDKVRTLEQLQLRSSDLEKANQALEAAHHEQLRLVELRTDELVQVRRELRGAKETLAMTSGRYGLVGKSEALRRLIERVERVARAEVPVVLYGPSGTGKELVARAIHEAAGRDAAPFVAVNCAAIPEGLLESELFGHAKGAFSGASREHRGLIDQAANGTLFLDEIADMPPRMQASLLRVLQDGTYFPVGSEQQHRVCVRVLSACRQPLRELVDAGRFREDLYYRVNVVEIEVPPLTSRREDIPLLCEHFLTKHANGDHAKQKHLSAAALKVLCNHDWPGNVRQLEHVLVNAGLLCNGEVIDAQDLVITGTPPSTSQPVPERASKPGASTAFHEQQREMMLEALTAHHWNRAAAARALGIPRRTFYRRLSAYGID